MSPTPVAASLGTAELAGLAAAIRDMAPAADDVERIDRLRQFEQLKSVIAAAQLLEATRFDTSQRVEQAVAGQPPARQGRGIDAQLALALRTSPWHARRWLGWATVLTRELPVTFAQLQAGRTTEWRALIMARETVWLSRADRAEVDALVGPGIEGLGDARVEAEAKKHAYRLDPAGAAERRRVAINQRRVTVRPRPDTMSSLTGTVSVEQGVAAWAALRREADAITGRGEGNGRTRDQIMADTYIERLTGQATATGVAIEVELIISTDTLFDTNTNDTNTDDTNDTDDSNFRDTNTDDTNTAGSSNAGGSSDRGSSSDEPALLTAAGIAPIPIPAGIARQLIADAPQAWLRRLYTAPRTGELITTDSTHRLFTTAQRRLIRHRDQYCTTPWCGAPIRHIDHATPADNNGPTTTRNGNGKCATCNHAKQAPNWTQKPGTHGGHGTITTPAAHHYPINPAQPPGWNPPQDPLVDYAWHLTKAA